MERWLELLKDMYFWVKILGGLALWYILSRMISNSLLSGGQDPLISVKRGPKLGLLVIVITAPVITWLVWKDLDAAILVAAVLLVIPVLLMCILFPMEPTLDR